MRRRALALYACAAASYVAPVRRPRPPTRVPAEQTVNVDDEEEEVQSLAELEMERWNSMDATEKEILSKSNAGSAYAPASEVRPERGSSGAGRGDADCRGRVAATPRPRRGSSFDESRRRRGSDADGS